MELTMRVGNVFSNSRNKTLRNNTSLTILNMTAADAHATGLAWASADIISTIWIGCVFSNSGELSLWNDTKFALCVLAANGIKCDVWWWRTEFVMENWVHNQRWPSLSITVVGVYISWTNPLSDIMTSSNGNIFRVTGHLCGEFTGPRWIPHTKASDAELWCLLWSAPEYTAE